MTGLQLDSTFKGALKLNPKEEDSNKQHLVKSGLTWDAFLGACDKLALLKGCTKQELLAQLAGVGGSESGQSGGSPGLITANRMFKRKGGGGFH